MEITHTWKVDRLDKINDGTGIVKNIAAYVLSTNGEVSVSAPTEVELTIDNIQDFIEFENLTEDLVISWVKTNLGEHVNYLELENEKFIERETERLTAASNPETIPSKPPWETP